MSGLFPAFSTNRREYIPIPPPVIAQLEESERMELSAGGSKKLFYYAEVDVDFRRASATPTKA